MQKSCRVITKSLTVIVDGIGGSVEQYPSADVSERSPLHFLKSWTRSRSHPIPQIQIQDNPPRSSSDTDTYSSTYSSTSSESAPLKGEYIHFHGDDSIFSPEITLERQYLKKLKKRGIPVRKAKIIHDARFCTYLALYHSSTVEELRIVCRCSEALNGFVNALPAFKRLRTLDITLETMVLQEASVPGLARLPVMACLEELRLEGWNRDLWSCLARTCAGLTHLRLVDLRGTYEGGRQSDIMQRMIDNNRRTLGSLRVSLFYEAGLNLRSLTQLRDLTISIPLVDMRREEDSDVPTHETIPESEDCHVTLLQQEIKVGMKVREIVGTPRTSDEVVLPAIPDL